MTTWNLKKVPHFFGQWMDMVFLYRFSMVLIQSHPIETSMYQWMAIRFQPIIFITSLPCLGGYFYPTLSSATSRMKRHLPCPEQKESPSNLSKYCACLKKWHSWLILLQLHQILHLPRKIAVQNQREICWKRMKRHLHCGADSGMIRA